MTLVPLSNLRGDPGLPSRGVLADGADVNELFGTAAAGSYRLAGARNYLNLPVGVAADEAVLESIPTDAGYATTQRLTTANEELWRKSIAVNSGVAEWSAWRETATTDQIPLPAASAAILDLAREDGWLAVYDPTNWRSRTDRIRRVMRIEDALGNLPPVESAATNRAPYFTAGQFGGMDGLEFEGGSSQYLRSEVFSTPKAQPTFIMTVAQSRTGQSVSTARMVVDGRAGGRNAIFQPVTDDNRAWAWFAQGERISRDLAGDMDAHVVGALFNGADSRFFVDGEAQYIRTGAVGPFTQALNGLTIGSSASLATGNTWDGWIGPVLIYDGVPPVEVRERMTRLLRGYSVASGASVDKVRSEAAVYASDDTVLYGKNADEPKIPASITKVMTGYIVRETITDERLDELVTVASSDGLTGSGTSPELFDGDQISYRDLLYLLMLPSHNAAARILARAVGDQLSGAGDGAEKFMARMMSAGTNWGWTGHNFQEPSGLSNQNRLSANQIAELMLRCHDEDPVLTGIMGSMTRQVNIVGANARTVVAVHTIDPLGEVKYPEWIAGKTGALNGVGNVAILVNEGGETRCVVTLRSTPLSTRFYDARRILDGNTEGTQSAAATVTDVSVSRALEDESSLSRQVLDTMYGEAPHATRVVTDMLIGADDSLAGAEAVLDREGRTVTFTIAALRFPADYSLSGAIPEDFRPARNSYGTARDRVSGRVVDVQVTPGGTVSVYGNESTDIVRLSMTWATA